MSLVPARNDLSFWRGATFRKRFTFLDGPDETAPPQNLTGYKAGFDIKDPDGNLLLELTPENGGLTLGGVEGTIDLYIGAEDTNPEWRAGSYQLWIQAPNGDKDVLLWGTIRSKGFF